MHFMPLLSLKETLLPLDSCPMVISGGIERDQWHDIFQLLNSFAKSSIFDVRLGSEPTSASGLLHEDTT